MNEVKLLFEKLLYEENWDTKKNYKVNYPYIIHVNDINSNWRLRNMPASLYIPFKYKNNIIEIKK